MAIRPSTRCRKCLLAIAFALGCTGCVSIKSASSGQIGCAEKDITITDDTSGWGSRTWTAECHGKKFFCSAVATGNNTEQVSCRAAVEGDKPAAQDAQSATPPVAAKASAEAAGCNFDTQCKGERICVKGECVEPAPAGSAPATAPPPAPAPTPASGPTPASSAAAPTPPK